MLRRSAAQMLKPSLRITKQEDGVVAERVHLLKAHSTRGILAQRGLRVIARTLVCRTHRSLERRQRHQACELVGSAHKVIGQLGEEARGACCLEMARFHPLRDEQKLLECHVDQHILQPRRPKDEICVYRRDFASPERPRDAADGKRRRVTSDRTWKPACSGGDLADAVCVVSNGRALDCSSRALPPVTARAAFAAVRPAAVIVRGLLSRSIGFRDQLCCERKCRWRGIRGGLEQPSCHSAIMVLFEAFQLVSASERPCRARGRVNRWPPRRATKVKVLLNQPSCQRREVHAAAKSKVNTCCR